MASLRNSERTDNGAPLASSGIAGLDEVLGGGYPLHHLYLVQGNPGSGKTTLGLQFLLAGAAAGERGFYVSLSETAGELKQVAESHGWCLDDIEIHELVPSEEALQPDSQYTMFQPSELELTQTTQTILERVDQLKPQRVVFDSLSEMRLLAQNPLRYRRQILGMKQYFSGRRCTVLLLDDRSAAEGDLHLESIAHGVIDLEQLAPEYGSERRRLRVSKLRGRTYRGGFHDFVIRKGGVELHPRLVAGEAAVSDQRPPMSSGLPGLDELLGGGFDRGISTLLVGPAGTGKSTLGMFVSATAARQGERAAIFAFDESRETMLKRAASTDLDFKSYIDTGLITVQRVNPAELAPGEFASRVEKAVAGSDGYPPAAVVMIDSLNGYLNSMPEERFLIIQLHELLSLLGRRGVITLMVVAQHGILGTNIQAPIDTSYLADCVILLRYFEAGGEVRQAISVVKKRTGAHERSIREYSIRSGRIEVGEILRDFQGVLTGTPMFRGRTEMLMRNSDGS